MVTFVVNNRNKYRNERRIRKMNCTEFEDMIPELLEGELSGEDRAKALEHVKECNGCNEMYKKLMSIREELGSELKISNVSFNSRKSNILNSIDKDKYKNRRKKQVRKNILIMTAIAATVAGVIIATPYTKMFRNNKLYGEDGKGASSRSVENVKPTIEKNRNIKNDMCSNMRVAVDEKINKYGDSIIDGKDEIYNKLSSKNNKILGIVKNENDFMIIRCEEYIFGYDKGSKKFYGFNDMSKIAPKNKDISYTAAATNDGRFIVFGSTDGDEKGVYILDLITNKVKIMENMYIDDVSIYSGLNSDLLLIVDYENKEFFEFKDLSKSMEYTSYSKLDQWKTLLSKDVYICDWRSRKSALPIIAKDVYGDRLEKNDKILCYISGRLYINRNGKLMEITKDNIKVIDGIEASDIVHIDLYNIYLKKGQAVSLFNFQTSKVYNYKNGKEAFMGSYNGDALLSYKIGAKESVLEFINGANPMKIIGEPTLTSIDKRNRITSISDDIDKEKILDIKTIDTK